MFGTQGESGFGRMFPHIAGALYTPDQMRELGYAMTLGSHIKVDSSLAAVYTYLGQFIDHDITNTLGGDRPSDGAADSRPPVQTATPALDLSSVYGAGFHDPRAAVVRSSGKMRLGACCDDLGQATRRLADLPREHNAMAIIPDGRNDNNLFVAQMHVMFLQLHNYFVDQMTIKRPELRYRMARANVIHHYHDLIVHDLLPKILHDEVYAKYFDCPSGDNTIAFTPPTASIPLEFSGAAFRFGHSIIRDSYEIGRGVPTVNINRAFALTGRNGMDGHDRLPERFVVDWKHFSANNRAKKISTPIKLQIPGFSGYEKFITVRNLLRGSAFALPCAQDICQFLINDGYISKKDELDERQLNPQIWPNEPPGILDNCGAKSYLLRFTPLWYYLLMEARARNHCRGNNECKLGVVGSHIVAATFKYLTRLPNHYSRPNDTRWHLRLKGQGEGARATIRDLINSVQS